MNRIDMIEKIAEELKKVDSGTLKVLYRIICCSRRGRNKNGTGVY